LHDVAAVNRDRATYWHEPHLAHEPDPFTSPILVTARYAVPAERQDEFVRAMQAVRRSRRRTGAVR
jgi:hypothetical protein